MPVRCGIFHRDVIKRRCEFDCKRCEIWPLSFIFLVQGANLTIKVPKMTIRCENHWYVIREGVNLIIKGAKNAKKSAKFDTLTSFSRHEISNQSVKKYLEAAIFEAKTKKGQQNGPLWSVRWQMLIRVFPHFWFKWFGIKAQRAATYVMLLPHQ